MVLVPRAFLKYSICMVYSDFLLSGKNPPLEGGEGQKPIVNFAQFDLNEDANIFVFDTKEFLNTFIKKNV